MPSLRHSAYLPIGPFDDHQAQVDLKLASLGIRPFHDPMTDRRKFSVNGVVCDTVSKAWEQLEQDRLSALYP